ncbi:uncharacterized protein J4E87_010735 [Alternaria ethzedia]|uniref:uncharacterized protein n=1 Tax=Alternaria ethzedia TaxID=181014 RepID=UPI0020C5AC1A|nr:uncharacterized protein J4E87_010735 [Alternaria ethzedia]KAI4610559.1 hypothetical protein J4E87_010735 [Alternaria ethzedia]
MFEKLFGVTKNTFLEKNVVRAGENDKYYEDKCTFCWGPYDEDHRAVRVQPCDHVFGDVCLEDMIDAPNGDKCPICRAVWFQPPTQVFLWRILLDNFDVPEPWR